MSDLYVSQDVGKVWLLSAILVLLPRLSSGQCTFMYYTSLYRADCQALGLTAKPDDLPEQIQIMDLSRNMIAALKYDFFHDGQYLQDIDLRNNHIQDIDSKAFIGCPNVGRINLAENRLTTLVNSTFQGLKSLRFLILQGNQLLEIHDGAFTNLPMLEELDLSRNGLKYLSPRAFMNIGPNLKSLNLAYNKLTMIPIELRQIMGTNFYQFHLYENPFLCDCAMRWIRNRMESKSVSFSFGNNQEPRCETPSVLRNRKFADLHPGDFACKPEMFSNSAVKLRQVGSNIRLYCNVNGDPFPALQWRKSGQLIDQFTSKRLTITNLGSINGNISYILDIKEATVNDSATYKCTASNTAGAVKVEYFVQVLLDKVVEPPQTVVVTNPDEDGALGKGSIAAIAVSAVLFIVVISAFSCYMMKMKKAQEKRRQKKRKAAEDSDDGEDKQKPDLIQHEQETEVRTNLLLRPTVQSDFESELCDQNYRGQLHQSRRRGPVMGQSTSQQPIYSSLPQVPTGHRGHVVSTNCNQTNNGQVSREQQATVKPPKTQTGVLRQKTASLHRQSSESLTSAPRKPPRTHTSQEELETDLDGTPLPPYGDVMAEYGTAV